jgi:type II secretory pathway pseudopilin PulG
VGFTLLEILLVFGLLVVLLGALAMAIDLHLRVAQLSRQRVEEAQLARVILQRIADDLRAAVPPETMDVRTLSQTLTSLLRASPETLELAQELGGSPGTGQDSASSAGAASSSRGTSEGSQSSSSDSSSSESTEEEGESETSEVVLGVPRSVPGIFGGPDWLQVDVSRLPRPDEYGAYLLTGTTGSSAGEWNRLSEVKTVLYGLMIPGSTMSISQTRVPAEVWGLYRDEVDRAIGALASEQNVLDQKVRANLPLAPEVVYLEFWYFDGFQWYDSWDSEAQGGLPLAVEVVIGLDMSRGLIANSPGSLEREEIINEPATLYRMVIQLPVARATEEVSGTTEETGTPEEE